MSMTINATKRNEQGKGASRRLRHQQQVPAIVYGGETAPCAIALDIHKISHLLSNEEAYTSVLELFIDDKKEMVIIKDLQRHRAKNLITHIDFQRINLKQIITTRVPLHFIGADDNAAIRLGAMLNQFINTIEVACLPTDLPHGIDVDVSGLELGEHLSLTDLLIPDGVDITALQHGDIETHNQTIASVAMPKKVVEEEEIEPTDEEGETEESSDDDGADDDNDNNDNAKT